MKSHWPDKHGEPLCGIDQTDLIGMAYTYEEVDCKACLKALKKSEKVYEQIHPTNPDRELI